MRWLMMDEDTGYCYWSSDPDAPRRGWDCPHWTGWSEERARAQAAANPSGTAAEAVRKADRFPG